MPTGIRESDSVMKKIALLILGITMLMCLVACNNQQPSTGEDEGGVSVDVITVEDGYLVVNGVKTEYKVEIECSHDWQTVTTPPTCTEDGYDVMTCDVCEKSIRTNVVTGAHEFINTYITDSSYHWYKCINCDAVKNKDPHTVDDDGICTVCHIPVSSTPGVIYDISDDGTYAMVMAYTGSAKKIRIADTYEGLPVMTIYDRAFYENETITSIIIPDSVTSIGSYAFQHCSSLTSIVIPDSVTYIGYSAFSGSSLTSIVIPDSVTYIAPYAFFDSSLTSGVIGDSVTSIGSYAFSGCSRLTSVVIPDSVTFIGEGAFNRCSSLTSVVIGDSVTSISSSAFSGCSKLQFNEYENCKYLGSKDNPHFALIDVTAQKLSSYTIHKDTKVIANSAFNRCSSLTSIVIPDGVISIDISAFYGCSSLTEIVIPDSITSIGSSAFSYCSSLKDVYYTGSEEEWMAITIGTSNSNLTSAAIHYNYVPEN